MVSYAATESGQTRKLADLLTDDMVFSGPLPKPVGKHEFIGLQTAKVAVIPDWKFNEKDFKGPDQRGADGRGESSHAGLPEDPGNWKARIPAAGKE